MWGNEQRRWTRFLGPLLFHVEILRLVIFKVCLSFDSPGDFGRRGVRRYEWLGDLVLI